MPAEARWRAALTAWAMAALALVSTPVVSAGASGQVVPVASDGHATHPVWYHDATAVEVGDRLFVAWNTNHAAVEARAWDMPTASWVGTSRGVSATRLDCSCVDSTGQNPNRHDVPTLFADRVGRVYALYGGGTASKSGSTGPYFRPAARIGRISSWLAEDRLPIPGAAYDFDTATDNLGTVHIVGQQGDNPDGAGSLVYMRFLSGTTSSPGGFDSPTYRVLVAGGFDRSACPWQATPGCDVYVIARIAAGPSNPADPRAPSPLYVAWGWSEKNLSNTCGDPAGFCNRGLYVARSLDGGRTWTDVAGTTSTDLSRGPIAHDDSRYAVVPSSTDVGLFKALAVTGRYPGTPWVAFQPEADLRHGTIAVAHPDAGTWRTQTIAGGRAWNNHLVMRATRAGRLYLWSDIAQSGANAGRLGQWVGSAAGGPWTGSQLAVGPNWFLTGRPVRGGEVLMWRAPLDSTTTRVEMEIVPVSG